MTLTVDQRTYLRAARYDQLFDNRSGKPVVQAQTSNRALRYNARIVVVEQMLTAGWIVLDGHSRYQLTDAGRVIWEAL